MPPFPARTLAECNAIMYAPGMPWEMVEIDDINGAKVRAYKSQPPSLRYLWLSTKVRTAKVTMGRGADGLWEQVHAKADYLVFEGAWGAGDCWEKRAELMVVQTSG